MDGPFLFHAAKCSVDLRKALSKLLESTNVNLYIAEDAMAELEALGDIASGAIAIASACTVIACGELRDSKRLQGASLQEKAQEVNMLRFLGQRLNGVAVFPSISRTE